MQLVYLEIVASLATLLCVIEAKRKKPDTWPLGILGALLFGYIFYETKLYADGGLQILYVIMGVVGWINWSKHTDSEEGIKPLRASGDTLATSLILVGGTTLVILSGVLKYGTDSPQPFLDAFIVTLSLIANYYLIKQYIQTWILWIIVDIAMIVLMYMSGLYFTMLLYGMLLTICVFSYMEWKKELEDGK